MLVPILIGIMVLLTSCSKNDQNNPDDPTGGNNGSTTSGLNYTQGDSGDLVYEDEESEWYVHIFKSGLLYEDAVKVVLPDPWYIPMKTEAEILKQCYYPNPNQNKKHQEERYVTSDGYTFKMHNGDGSVSKAGSSTTYSVLGLRKRIKVIDVPF